ncbi:hypothetical protein ACFUIW_33715 [Streptomyces sp. NPDC057245]|uniref:hypothetical protein n=1 Tax=Streptomyces sp. NPDC057245 TaxID=3346065 RepID=UPI0036418B2E
MPNRQAIIGALTQDVLGAQQFNGLRGECVNMPTDDYEAVRDAMEAVVERVARAVNWERLLREASYRHLHLHHERKDDGFVTGVCHECLVEALLADDTGAPNWEKHPVSPRRFPNLDWPTVVASNLKHREVAHWHPYMPPRKQEPATTAAEAAGDPER